MSDLITTSATTTVTTTTRATATEMVGSCALIVDDPSALVAPANYRAASTAFKRAYVRIVPGVQESYFTDVTLTQARRLTEIRYLQQSGQVNVDYTIVFPQGVRAVEASVVTAAGSALQTQLNTELVNQGLQITVTSATLATPTARVMAVPTSPEFNLDGTTAVDLTFITIVIAVAVAMGIS